MKKKMYAMFLALSLILCQLQGTVALAEEAVTQEGPVTDIAGEEAASAGETVAEADSVTGVVSAEPASASAGEAEDETDVVGEEPEAAKEPAAEVEPKENTITADPAADTTEPEGKDVWIDNTVDTSRTFVTAVVHLTGSGGISGEYNALTLYSGVKSVTYSNPKPQAVQEMVDEAYKIAKEFAEDRKSKAKSGEFHMSVAEYPGRTWDNRVYELIESGDAVLIGDTDYMAGAFGDNSQVTRTHIASGDYGKEYYIRIEANGYLNAYDIATNKTGDGEGDVTISAINDSDPVAGTNCALEGDKVTVTMKANPGSLLKGFSIFWGETQIEAGVWADGTTEEFTTTFTMPDRDDVSVDAYFVTHVHSLTYVDQVDPTCEKDGTEEYWTCSECKKMFSDEEGTKEITEPVVIPATGHDWDEWIVTQKATTTETGTEMRTCKNDPSHTETRVIPIIEEEKKEEKGGSDDSSSSSGSRTSTTTKSRSSKESSKKGAPTGDSSNPAAWGTLMTVSLMAVLLSTYAKRRRR